MLVHLLLFFFFLESGLDTSRICYSWSEITTYTDPLPNGQFTIPGNINWDGELQDTGFRPSVRSFWALTDKLDNKLVADTEHLKTSRLQRLALIVVLWQSLEILSLQIIYWLAIK